MSKEIIINITPQETRVAILENGMLHDVYIERSRSRGAALESGWGKQEIRHADNQPSFNLFGIKAGQGWKGAVVETTTTEYINEAPNKMVEKFRAYTSYAESFQDYANLMLKNPRYAAVLRNQDAQTFAQGLQQAGYATDPHYADKLMRIINSSSIRDHQTI